MTTELNPNVAAPAPQPTSKRKRALLILLVVVLIAGIGWALYYVLVGRWHESTDDAYVQGNVVSITPQATGTVVSIGADDGMKVDSRPGTRAAGPERRARRLRTGRGQSRQHRARGARPVQRGRRRTGRYPRTPGGRAESACRYRASQRTGRDRRRVGRGTGACARGTRLGRSGAVGIGRTAVAQPRAGRCHHHPQPAAGAGGRQRSCARRTSTCSVRRSSHRSPVSSPSAPCSLASACSPA